MKLLIVALLLVGFHVGKSFAQQPLLTEDPQSLVSAQNASIQLYRENTAEVFDAVLAGKKSSNSDWYIVQRNGAGRDARIVLITNCSALSICSVTQAVKPTGCHQAKFTRGFPWNVHGTGIGLRRKMQPARWCGHTGILQP
jgi:hypothetical protein